MKVKRKECKVYYSSVPNKIFHLDYYLNRKKYSLSRCWTRNDHNELTWFYIFYISLSKNDSLILSECEQSPKFNKWLSKKENRIFQDMKEIYDSLLVIEILKNN